MKFTGAYCPTCKVMFDENSNLNVPWSWQKSQALHERGTGHKMKRFNHKIHDLMLLMDSGKVQEL